MIRLPKIQNPTDSRSLRAIFPLAPLGLFAGALGAFVPGADVGRDDDVVIPHTAPTHNNVLGAYVLLRNVGLRVGTTAPMKVWSLGVPFVGALDPPPGTRVAVGSTVWISPTGGPTGSPAVSKARPGYAVPNFVGESAQAAVSWVNSCLGLYWSIPHLPALAPSEAPELLDNYRVTAQEPEPGSTLYQGFFLGRGYHPTPLTLTVELAPSSCRSR